MRLSVIIPTYQRRDLVLTCVQALTRQQVAPDFEVIVVVDGSTDGSAAALRDLIMPFPLTVLEQPNRGPAAARSAGGFAARGDILLFLDDDMEADPRLLAEHERFHQPGARIVVGHIPLHPASPDGLLSSLVKQWLDRRTRRLSVDGASVRASDLIGGQISVPREGFLAVGGFDTRLACGEDAEFGYRLLRHGYQAAFNPNAISWQRYTVGPRQFLRQWRESGRASVRFARKHPEMADQVFDKAVNRRRYRVLAGLPALTGSLSWLAVALVARGNHGPVTRRLFFAAQALTYWRGAREAGGRPRPRPLRVLAYHAIADTAGAGRFEPYGVPPEDFRQQVVALRRAGYRFVSSEEVVHFLRGAGGLPRRPVLLTFDDCYVSVLEHAVPILEQNEIPAVAFAVTARVGGWNDWTRATHAPGLPLLDLEGLKRLAQRGVEIGAHSRTHRPLPGMSDAELAEEVGGSCEDVGTIGLGRARLFAYPHGAVDERVRDAVESAGCQAAFTVTPGLARPNSDPFRVPRIEILRGEVGWRFRLKVASGGRARPWTAGRVPLLRRLWMRLAKPAFSRLARLGSFGS